MRLTASFPTLGFLLAIACSSSSPGDLAADAGEPPADAASPDAASSSDDASLAFDAAPPPCVTPAECAAQAEERAAARLQAIEGDAEALALFLRAMPKGGDLHNHLSG